MKRTIGGDRLGSGKKMTVDLRTYERSTHDLGYVWRSTMAAGTLVPFMSEVGLPGDTFDIDLDVDGKTHPTLGPLFGSYKIQLDVFLVPVRLYQAQLHNNKMGIGLDMSRVKLPQIIMDAAAIDKTKDPDNQQINPSSIFSYLNIRGLGGGTGNPDGEVRRYFNAVPYLGYWDIYKNYYANKQEEVGAVIHNDRLNINEDITSVTFRIGGGSLVPIPRYQQAASQVFGTITVNDLMVITVSGTTAPDPENVLLYAEKNAGGDIIKLPVTRWFTNWVWNAGTKTLTGRGTNKMWDELIYGWNYPESTDIVEKAPQVTFFPLENLDTMKENILAQVKLAQAFTVNAGSIAPYGLALKASVPEGGPIRYSKMSSQEGLALKTYQSDVFNNWMSTEWIDGDGGINEITAVDVSEGVLKLDALLLARKVYDMLNRIAVSGGTYYDWMETVYSHEGMRRVDTPVYLGGLSKELVFQEVISNAGAESDGESQPLGTLAGRGVMSGKHKGGKVTVKVDEPSYVIGIASLTPRLDYSQGNKWDTGLQTMNDFHKPGLDEIGFQDLITDQMAWFDTEFTDGEDMVYKSAGKQPAWINYMTNYNVVRGNFAIDGNQMFMTLNRKYEIDEETGGIKDLTTYIDPVKFNHVFAQQSRDAQNFWMQIGVDITARRKMSAKIMPNL